MRKVPNYRRPDGFLEIHVQSDLVSYAAFSQNNAVATTWLAWERTA